MPFPTFLKKTKKNKSKIWGSAIQASSLSSLLLSVDEAKDTGNKGAGERFYIHTHTHTHTHIYIYIYIPDRSAPSFSSPFIYLVNFHCKPPITRSSSTGMSLCF
uniref:Uncharacterized protein n=1 Tax=Trypanosoma vivax (strain Y486) TaxID=1055687 RepID=G0TYI6_TRYVY|nr:hypothetical protein TVY486_0703670 [Trypanosoma vivax Y486]